MCKPKHLVVQYCPLCKETLGVSSTKFSPVAFRSLLYPFYNGRKGIRDGCICSCLFLPCLLKQCIFLQSLCCQSLWASRERSNNALRLGLLLHPCAFLAEGISKFPAGKSQVPVKLNLHPDLQRAEQIGRTKCCCSVACCLVFLPLPCWGGTFQRLWWLNLWMLYQLRN